MGLTKQRSLRTSTFEVRFLSNGRDFYLRTALYKDMASAADVAFPVRVNGKLAEEFGVSRLSVSVQDPATINDILEALGTEYPESVGTMCEAIPFVSGHHKNTTEKLVPGQEITLLMPAAGG